MDPDLANLGWEQKKKSPIRISDKGFPSVELNNKSHISVNLLR
jgi:hypothetical protein